MKTKTINLYSYDELEKDIQQKVLQNFRDDDDYYYLSDDMQYKLDELLTENNITPVNTRIYYSLSYSQGDGAMFSGEVEWKGYNFVIKHTGMYYHYNSKTISVTDDMDSDLYITIQKDFDDLYISICKELARYGYDCIENHNSEDNLMDMINANDYLFTKDGKIESEN